VVKSKIRGFAGLRGGLWFAESKGGPWFEGKVRVFVGSRVGLWFAELRGGLWFEGKVVACL
jgi:hypothetical protein